jgi:hypothetical protein
MPDLSIRPLVRRRGKLWAAVCWACLTRTSAVEMAVGYAAAADHASTEEHQVRVRAELIRRGVIGLAEMTDAPMGDEFWSARDHFTAAARSLAELLVATGEESEEVAPWRARQLIQDQCDALDASGLSEAA